MSQNEKNFSCVLCNAYLFEEDDVVYCPVCGAPHHRECYNSIGHCALEEKHGTDEQYDLLKKKNENKEKPVIKAEEPKSTPENDNYTPGDEIFEGLPKMDFFGGIPSDFPIEKDISAKEVRNFVISNTPRYIPKFTQLSKKNKTSWNFIAFFFPAPWLLSRKMYKQGFVVAILFIITSLLAIPMSNALTNMGIEFLKTSDEIAQALIENFNNVHWGVWIAALFGSVLDFAMRIVVAMLGDYWYREHVITNIREIKETSDDVAEDFRRKGGVSLVMLLIGLAATYYLPQIIAGLFL